MVWLRLASALVMGSSEQEEGLMIRVKIRGDEKLKFAVGIKNGQK